MKAMGLQVYRFSLSWTRLIPEGTGAPNPKGIEFYNKLIDSLLEAGIQPCVTLFHWDFPSSLYRRGGWLNPASPQWFEDYARLVAQHFGKRVKLWLTQNEPYGFIQAGHHLGFHAPGDRLSWKHTLLAAHHALMAHGRAVKVLRESSPGSKIGIACCGYNAVPFSERPADIEAARVATFRNPKHSLEPYGWFCDPVYLGHYPEETLKLYSSDVPKITADEMEQIHQPLDFFGLNIYQGVLYKQGADGQSAIVRFKPGMPTTAVPWPIVPEVLRWTPRFLYERYGLPIFVTENGMANHDVVSMDGKVHDPQRIDYTRRYLLELEKAHKSGTPILGYIHWSVMDNFEWNCGYRLRFGLTYVEYTTQRRIIKDSGHWYRHIIETNGAALHENDISTLA